VLEQESRLDLTGRQNSDHAGGDLARLDLRGAAHQPGLGDAGGAEGPLRADGAQVGAAEGQIVLGVFGRQEELRLRGRQRRLRVSGVATCMGTVLLKLPPGAGGWDWQGDYSDADSAAVEGGALLEGDCTAGRRKT